MTMTSNFKSGVNSRLNVGAWAKPKMSQARDQHRSKHNWPQEVGCIKEGDEDEGFLAKQSQNTASLWFGPGPAVCFIFNVLIFLFFFVSFRVDVRAC